MTEIREFVMPWIDIEADPNLAKLLVEAIIRIQCRPDSKLANMLIREMRDYEARKLMFTVYPLGRGPAFRVDSVSACR